MIQFRGIHPALRAAAEGALQWAQAYGVEPTITSVLRTWNEQSALYDRHRQCVREGKYPHARGCHYPANPPGWSAHQYGLAFDSTVPGMYDDWWRQVREAFGFSVPGNDTIHAEHPEAKRYVRFVNEQL